MGFNLSNITFCCPDYIKTLLIPYQTEVRLKWLAGDVEELEQYPASLGLPEGYNLSGWIQAMWSHITDVIDQGLPSEGIMLGTLSGVGQDLLSNIVMSLFTGESVCYDITIENQLWQANFKNAMVKLERVA